MLVKITEQYLPNIDRVLIIMNKWKKDPVRLWVKIPSISLRLKHSHGVLSQSAGQRSIRDGLTWMWRPTAVLQCLLPDMLDVEALGSMRCWPFSWLLWPLSSSKYVKYTKHLACDQQGAWALVPHCLLMVLWWKIHHYGKWLINCLHTNFVPTLLEVGGIDVWLPLPSSSFSVWYNLVWHLHPFPDIIRRPTWQQTDTLHETGSKVLWCIGLNNVPQNAVVQNSITLPRRSTVFYNSTMTSVYLDRNLPNRWEDQ